MKRILILPLLFICFFSPAQVYFNRAYDSNNWSNGATSIVSDYSTGYIIAAQETDTVKRSLFFINIDQYGDTVWTKLYGKPGLVYYTGISGSVIHTIDGNYALAGSFADVNDTVNTSDVLLIKLSSNGDTLWSKTYGSPYWDAAQICAQTKDSGYILVGNTDPINDGTINFLLIKTDSLGNLLWQKTYGGGGYDRALTGQLTLDGGYILSGMTNSFGAGGYEHYIVKTDSAGNLKWQKTYGTILDDGGCYAIQTQDSGYILTGSLDLGVGRQLDGSIRKVDKNGNQVWLKTFGTEKDEWFDTRAIELTDGSIVVAGSMLNSSNRQIGWLMKVNANGDSLWSRTYAKSQNISDFFYDVKPTQDNGFIMCGSTWITTQDVWVVKVDSLGCEVANCNIGINEEFRVLDLKFQVYPNPTDGKFCLSLNTEGNVQIFIYDIMGKIVYENLFNGSKSITTNIDFTGKPKGIYFIKAMTADGLLITDKIICK